MQNNKITIFHPSGGWITTYAQHYFLSEVTVSRVQVRVSVTSSVSIDEG